jgi:hypothetical protein
MTSVTVQLTPETEQRLRLQASRRGETLEVFLQRLAEQEAAASAEVPDTLAQGVAWLTHRTAEEVHTARQRILAASPPPRELPAGKTVLDLVEGKWPGAETDAKIRDALDRLS